MAEISVGLIMLAAYGLLSAGAALQDIRQLRISNLWSVGLISLSLAGILIQLSPDWWQHLISFFLALAAGMALFAAGWMGGGDAKLFAATALAFSLDTLISFAIAVVLLGGLVALASILFRGIKGSRHRQLPYGVPIGLAAIICSIIFRSSTPFA
jgi:prepilin peptidase CpaA